MMMWMMTMMMMMMLMMIIKMLRTMMLRMIMLRKRRWRRMILWKMRWRMMMWSMIWRLPNLMPQRVLVQVQIGDQHLIFAKIDTVKVSSRFRWFNTSAVTKRTHNPARLHTIAHTNTSGLGL